MFVFYACGYGNDINVYCKRFSGFSLPQCFSVRELVMMSPLVACMLICALISVNIPAPQSLCEITLRLTYIYVCTPALRTCPRFVTYNV